jgi:peptide deformylase
MILKIVRWPNKVLNTKCSTIKEDSKELQDLISNMFETLASTTGIGLAAPQVGVDIRLFVTKYGTILRTKKVWINPLITWHSEDFDVMGEGCLSLPGQYFDGIMRYKSIKIKYLNEKFEEKEETYSGYYARLIQHEYNHLQGITLMEKSGRASGRVKENKVTRYNDYLNEHKDIDPYSEEDWKDDYEFNFDDFQVISSGREIIYTVETKIKETTVLFKITFDDDHYVSDFELVDEENQPEWIQDIFNNNYDQLRDIIKGEI